MASCPVVADFGITTLAGNIDLRSSSFAGGIISTRLIRIDDANGEAHS